MTVATARRVFKGRRTRPRDIWWTRERVLDGLRRFYLEQGWAPLTFWQWNDAVRRLHLPSDTRGRTRPYPSQNRVTRYFESLMSAWVAAGEQLPRSEKFRHRCFDERASERVVIWKPGDAPVTCQACGQVADATNSERLVPPWERPPARRYLSPDKHRACVDRPCNFCKVWSEAESQYVRQRAGQVGLPELTDELNALFPNRVSPFTPWAVKMHAWRKLGLSTALNDGGMTMRDLENSLGAWHQTMQKRWIEPGLLRASRRRQLVAGKDPEWRFERADVVRFLEQYPWAYDWSILNEPWRTIGQHVWADHPLVRLRDLQRYLRLESLTFWHRANGVRTWAPHHVRFHGASARQGEPVFAIQDLPKIRARMAELRKERRAAGLDRRKNAGRPLGRRHYWNRTCRACGHKTRGLLASETPPTRCPQCGGWLRPYRPSSAAA